MLKVTKTYRHSSNNLDYAERTLYTVVVGLGWHYHCGNLTLSYVSDPFWISVVCSYNMHLQRVPGHDT